ncbi:MAG: hypothetical protein HOD63_02285 [Bacteroidetes bacterium]|jgi:hypothetical protein|nr:hypothetical protein [Bacteroidota bacterium]MBT5530019.1 hypothetical protein [Cytophagia bacterium]MBT3802898.1 hypothetical protein [Bacteroidota bacterium]MBT3933242.1 hypothetical protein [Bacteroidota bacterium]MBT4337398.1 hypothetical protein [Bacteroidota bacterium]
MPYISKFLQENEVLEEFRKRFKDFPKGKVNKTESPDFIIRVSKKKSVGVELTQLTADKIEADHFFDNLKALLDKKEEKLNLYRKNILDEYWLIVYLYLGENIIPQSILNKIEAYCFVTSFTKVFLFDIDGKKYWLL